MALRRYAVVGPELAVRNVVLAEAGWSPELGLAVVASETARIGDTFDPVQGVFLAPAGALDAERAAARDEVQRRRDDVMRGGCPYGGLHIEVDDASRANLLGMVVAAGLAIAGTAPWPENLSRGWITLENERIPLPEPAQATALGLFVLNWYSGLIQFAADLKKSVLAADDPRAVAAAADWSPWQG
jgi:hypothetical protein